MSWWRRWVVLVPGNVEWVERRTRELLAEHDEGREHHFMVIPGQGRYQAIVEKDRDEFGPQYLLGELLSLECEEPVYAIDGTEDFPCISCFMRGEREREDQEPDDLVRSLGCESEWTVEPPPKPLKKQARIVALIQGLSATRVRNALAKEAGRPLPVDFYRLEEIPQGLLLTDGTGDLGLAHNSLSQRFPDATIYSVAATPSLNIFVVGITHKRRTREFACPPREFPIFPVLHEVLGEREPERILAALGIPKEWFKL